MSRRRLATLALVLAAGTSACTSGSGGSSSGVSAPTGVRTPSVTSSPSTSAPSTSTATPGRPPSTAGTSPSGASSAAGVLAGMSLRQRVGQLIMIDCPSTGVTAATRTALTRDDVGSVILDGTTQSGRQAVSGVTQELRSLGSGRAGLFIATDQEGGLVQRLQGSGFDRIPSGTEQGQLAPSTLRDDARGWGRQLRAAGVNVNLAPVLDVVPAGGGSNPPIGDLDRQYGSTPATVTSHGLAYAAGMTDAGVVPVVKHFPGLGRVSGNTDTTAGVTDDVTTAEDPNLQPFRAAVAAGVPFVMMSTAIYDRIDPGTPAAFSSKIINGLLRSTFGFRGVVISDDLGAARQVSNYSPGQRAVRFVRAGGDIVLSVVGDQAGELTSALVNQARSDASFRSLVDAAALRVLSAKQRAGLLG